MANLRRPGEGVRTREEIDRGRDMPKALRGDFLDVKSVGDGVKRARAAPDAVSR